MSKSNGNLYHLIVTGSINQAAEEIRSNLSVKLTGHNRGFGPDGKQYLIVHEDTLPTAVLGMELSSYEYILSNNAGAHDVDLNSRLVGTV
ncbi:hypothetical protein [uncultured Pelagimonas sp.]|uniref:hypothetical protein n=1 Tax=uncultured Pelagimonas sp. TaxID=1618102 RepID=UPI0026389A81|nr:hypothetical protein [uncultured Pelagimonas sp.]